MKKLLLALALWFAFASAALATLKGIGGKKAQAIIDHRKKNGQFKTVDDLEKVEGIGSGTMKQLRSQLSVTGKTTVEKTATKTKAGAPAKAKVADTKKAEPAKGVAMKDEKKAEKK